MYDLPSEVYIQEREGRGRGLFVRKRFRAGSTIHSTKPLISVLSSFTLSTHCSACGLSPVELSILNPNTPQTQLRRCTACRVFHYCSTRCQKEDWHAHKEECAAHRALKNVSSGSEGGRIMLENIRALGRLCWARKKGGTHGRDPEWWAEVEAMESHSKRLPEQGLIALSRTVQQLQYYLSLSRPLASSGEPQPVSMDEFGFTSASQLISLVSAVCPPTSHLLTPASPNPLSPFYTCVRAPSPPSTTSPALARIASTVSSASRPSSNTSLTREQLIELNTLQFQVNSFTLSSPSLTPIGVAISPTIALCNHSCQPNAVVVFPKGAEGMTIVAISDIAEGEEILTSYIDVGLPKKKRQEDLKNIYGFDCACGLCGRNALEGVKEEWVDPRWCVKHIGCATGKGVAGLPSTISKDFDHTYSCNLCGEAFSVDQATLQALLSKGKDLLRREEQGNLDKLIGLQSLSQIIPPLLSLQPPSSYPLLPLLRLHSLLLTPPTTSKSYNQLLSSLALSYQGSEAVYPPGHPTLAIILSEWAKVLIMETPSEWGENGSERMKQGVVVLRRAVAACERGFGGEGGLVGAEMRGLLRGCEGELQLAAGSRRG